MLRGAGEVSFSRVYRAEDIITLNHDSMPTVSVWPGVAFPEGDWQYYLL